MTAASVGGHRGAIEPDVIFYHGVRALILGFSRVYWRFSVEGTEHLPTEGPYVVAPVHRSNIDTPLVALVSRRRLRFMGKDSLWKQSGPGWFLSALGGFPVHRGAVDREALRRCIEVIEGGEPLVIFPEGARREGSKVAELFDGAAYLAIRTGVPILPVGIGGSERAMGVGAKGLRPGKIHVVVGPPLFPPAVGAGSRAPRRAVAELTAALHAELQRLFDRAQIQAGA